MQARVPRRTEPGGAVGRAGGTHYPGSTQASREGRALAICARTHARHHFLQQWHSLSDPAVEDALCGTPMFREFAGLDVGRDNLPDESIILRFRHLLEVHNLSLQVMATVNATLSVNRLMLKQGTVVNITLIAAPRSAKNKSGECDPEMYQTNQGSRWHFGMKAHIGVDAESGLVHTVVCMVANVNDVTQASRLMHGEETDVFTDAGYQGVAKHGEVQGIRASWQVAMRAGRCWALDKGGQCDG